jgi:hypothetical protein
VAAQQTTSDAAEKTSPLMVATFVAFTIGLLAFAGFIVFKGKRSNRSVASRLSQGK